MADQLPPLRDVIARHGLAAKKSLGQNFLFDLNLTRRIARAAGANDGGLFYEVGPGPGGLTRALLAEGAEKVIAVERDDRCLPALAEIAAAWPGRLELIGADAMKLDEATLLPPGVRIAANLPYNVGTALLIKWLTSTAWPPFWQSATLMFQKEVAQRITAAPGGEHYGRLSVLAQWRATAKILFDVNPHAFTPPPSVTSAIVRLEPRAEPLAPCALTDLERVTAAAFGQRRKMLRQSLKPLGGETLIARAGLDPTARPEDLAIADFAALGKKPDAMTYLVLKVLHILGAIVILGTGTGIAFFMLMAHRSRDAAFIARTAGVVVTADFLFTATAIIAQPITGWLLMREAGYSLADTWLAASLALYLLAVAFWLPVVWMQMRMRDLARAAVAAGAPLPAEYHRLFRRWFLFGFPGFGATLAILVLMVTKP